jgi:protein-disulfide isomerase
MRLTRLVVALVAASLLIGTAVTAAELPGSYEAIGTVPAAGSQKVVKFEEFLNFTCPHCNAFRLESKPLFDKYDDRVLRIYVPILFRGQADYPLRLFYVAVAEGKTEAVKDALFDAAFRFRADIYSADTVAYIASELGLADAYRRNANAGWVTKLIQDGHKRANEAQIRGTPTVVLAHTVKVTPVGGMQQFLANLDGLIGGLLAK